MIKHVGIRFTRIQIATKRKQTNKHTQYKKIMAKSTKKVAGVVGDNTKPLAPLDQQKDDTTSKPNVKLSPVKKSRKPAAKKKAKPAKTTTLTDGMGTGQSFKVDKTGVVAIDITGNPASVKTSEEPIATYKVESVDKSSFKLEKAEVVVENVAKPVPVKKDTAKKATTPIPEDEIKSKYEKTLEETGTKPQTPIAVNANDKFSGNVDTLYDELTQGTNGGPKKPSPAPVIPKPTPQGTSSPDPQYDSLRLPNPTVPANPKEGTAGEPRDLTPNMLENPHLLVPVDMTEGGSVAEMVGDNTNHGQTTSGTILPTDNVVVEAPKPEYFVTQPTKTIMRQILEKHDTNGKLIEGEGLKFDNARIYSIHIDCNLPEPHPLVIWGADIEACIRPMWLDGNPEEVADKKILHFRLTSDGGNRDAQMLEPIVCQVDEDTTITIVPKDEHNFPFGNNCHIMDTDKLNGLTLNEIGRLYSYCHPYTTFMVQLVVQA